MTSTDNNNNNNNNNNNAFNSLHRDSMLASVNNVIPELAAYCHLAYAEATCLRFGSFVILSQEGAQQWDPLGPLLFCLPLQPVLVQLESPLAFGYLDDLTLGGTPEVVAADVDLIEKGCSKLGLTLNRNKCELIAVDPEAITENILSQFVHVSPSTAKLLGAPLSSEEALTSTLDICTTDLGVIIDIVIESVLRRGTPLVRPGTTLSAQGRQARHSNVNDIIHRSLNRAGIPAIKEPSRLTRSDGKRPDGQTLMPWNDGRTLLWDATVVDTVAASYITETAAAAGGAAVIAATRKHAKYSELERSCLWQLKLSALSTERASPS